MTRITMCIDICTINIRVSIRVRGLHLVFFVFFVVQAPFLGFAAKISHLLRFVAKISHSPCSSFFHWFHDFFHGVHRVFHGVHCFFHDFH